MNKIPTVAVKRKNIQQVIDYCLDKKIELTIKPKASGNSEEWHFEFNVIEVPTAILLGMFLRENKLELIGYSNALSSAVTPTPVAKSSSKKNHDSNKENGFSKEEPTVSMNFQEQNMLLGAEIN